MENVLRIFATVTNRLDELVDRIEKIFIERNWKPIDLVNASGVPAPSIYRLMNRTRGVEPDTLKAIGAALSIPTLELAYYIGLSDEMPSEKAVLNDTFLIEWRNVSDQRRRELLEILRVLNAVDRKTGGTAQGKK